MKSMLLTAVIAAVLCIALAYRLYQGEAPECNSAVQALLHPPTTEAEAAATADAIEACKRTNLSLR